MVFKLVQWWKIALIVILVVQLDTNITMKLKCSKSPEKEKSKSIVEVTGPHKAFSRWCTYLSINKNRGWLEMWPEAKEENMKIGNYLC